MDEGAREYLLSEEIRVWACKYSQRYKGVSEDGRHGTVHIGSRVPSDPAQPPTAPPTTPPSSPSRPHSSETGKIELITVFS